MKDSLDKAGCGSPNDATRQAQAEASFEEWFLPNNRIPGVMKAAFREVFMIGWLKADASNPEKVDSGCRSTLNPK